MKRLAAAAILLFAIAALGQNENFAYPRRLQVPKQYGKFVAVYSDQLLFEAEDGTIRIYAAPEPDAGSEPIEA